jgi:predicted PurR-regulated permease PerM
VIIPAAIIIMTAGNIIGGISLIILGLIGVAVTQNLLKPKLLGNRSGLHPGLVLLSILGGIAWIGVIGFLVGPLLTSLFIVIWNQFGLRYRQQLEQRSDIDQESL